MGRHMLLLTVKEMSKYLASFYAFNVSVNLAATFIKLSLLFQYLRVFSRGSWPHLASRILIVITSLWGATFSLIAIYPCTTVSDFWSAPPDKKCWMYGSSNGEEFATTFM